MPRLDRLLVALRLRSDAAPRTVRFGASRQVVLEECEAVARTLVRWRCELVDVDDARVAAVSRSRLGHRSWITIEVQGDGDGAQVQAWVSDRMADLGSGGRALDRFEVALADGVQCRLERREAGT
jgi:hypothetical protein